MFFPDLTRPGCLYPQIDREGRHFIRLRPRLPLAEGPFRQGAHRQQGSVDAEQRYREALAVAVRELNIYDIYRESLRVSGHCLVLWVQESALSCPRELR